MKFNWRFFVYPGVLVLSIAAFSAGYVFGMAIMAFLFIAMGIAEGVIKQFKDDYD